MFCNKCGAQIEEGKLFCTSCGMAVGSEVVSEESVFLRYKKLIIAVLAGIAVIAGICFTVGMLNEKNEQKANLVDTANSAAKIWLDACIEGDFDKAMEVCAHSSDTTDYYEFEERTRSFIDLCASCEDVSYELIRVVPCDDEEVDEINSDNVCLKSDVKKASDADFEISFDGEESYQDLRVVKMGDEWYVL